MFVSFYVTKFYVAFSSSLVVLDVGICHCPLAVLALELQILKKVQEKFIHRSLLRGKQANCAFEDLIGLEFGIFRNISLVKIFEAMAAGSGFAARALQDVLSEVETDWALVVLEKLVELGVLVKVVFG